MLKGVAPFSEATLFLLQTQNRRDTMKNILLCVSGGIAVYKAVALTSKLTQAGFQVKVLMTKSAQQFVQPLSFQVMSKNDVFYDTFDEKDSQVIAHIDLADWADLVIIAPATANIIGKLAHGLADDMVTTTLLATTAPVWIAPAMNVHMYDHPAVLRNIEQLYQDGYRFIEPSEGYLACGYVGKGRLEEPEKITALALQHFRTTAHEQVLVVGGAMGTIANNQLTAPVHAAMLATEVAKAFASRQIYTRLITHEQQPRKYRFLFTEQMMMADDVTKYVREWQQQHPNGLVLTDVLLPKGYTLEGVHAFHSQEEAEQVLINELKGL